MQTLQTKKAQRQKNGEQELADRRLLEEYHDTLIQLRQLRAIFQQVTDPELVSACVYEMNALQQRYSYLLQQIRAEKLTCLRVLR